MRRVGLGVAQVPTTQIIEREHRFGIAGEGFGRRQLHRVELRPNPLASLVAKRAQPTFSGDPSAGEDEDVLRHGGGGLASSRYSISNAFILARTSATTRGSAAPLRTARRARQSRLLIWSARITLGGLWLITTSNT